MGLFGFIPNEATSICGYPHLEHLKRYGCFLLLIFCAFFSSVSLVSAECGSGMNFSGLKRPSTDENENGGKQVLSRVSYDLRLQRSLWPACFRGHVRPAEIRRIVTCANSAQHVHCD